MSNKGHAKDNVVARQHRLTTRQVVDVRQLQRNPHEGPSDGEQEYQPERDRELTTLECLPRLLHQNRIQAVTQSIGEDVYPVLGIVRWRS